MERKNPAEDTLSFFDPDLYVNPTDGDVLDPHFQCMICLGVVIDP